MYLEFGAIRFDMEDDMIDVSAGNEQPSGNGNGSRSMEDSMVSKLDGGSVKGEGFRSNKRPTRESVLKRLSEALMRRTLTKVCTCATLQEGFIYLIR